MHQWYNVSNKQIFDFGGKLLLTQNENSLFKILSVIYSDYNWLPWKFDSCPETFWNDIENQKWFMTNAIKELNINKWSDWYSVSNKDFTEIGGKILIKQYNNSMFQLLSKFYPENEWLPWRFESCPQSYWHSVENQRKFVDWAGRELQIKSMNDWYKVSNKVKKYIVAMVTV